jgi:pectinesterase
VGNHSTTNYILVLAGDYEEQLNVTRRFPLYILGQTASPKNQSANLVTVNWSAINETGPNYADNAYTSVLTVAPNLNASLTGSGPTGFNVSADTPWGNVDFRVYNIDFRNTFADQAAGPKLALSVSRANAGFYFTGFYSYQDTIYIGHLGNAYMYGNEIAGQTDFLYGFGTAWIENSNLTLRACGGGVIAWKGTNTTFENKYGCYVSNSYINGANSSIVASFRGKCSLGRPWNAQHRSVYINTYMDSCIKPQGYTIWGTSTPNFNNYTFMAEYDSYGPGWNLTARLDANVTRVLDRAEEKPYACPRKVFLSQDRKHPDFGWIDRSYLNSRC